MFRLFFVLIFTSARHQDKSKYQPQKQDTFIVRIF